MDHKKINLSLILNDIITHKNLTQIEVAKILGIDQSKVSALLNGKLRSFSLERLMNFINLMGYDILIRITPSERKPGVTFISFDSG